ncbi:hypothetical protein ND861_10300 [Leptospira sp. 2 VSF19]|uniref:DUF3298 domain-containing protein n=1 Tax=Leptospira soteropolitanensis TaxID=2950025 RepID=A0AAW5VMQ1_9LEPT|nr:hypothetical protein [Leptospira soteropolitanensis]MCW7494752.1 hypothetical protein [Leptospira soteropolitanensis]MCW7500626.1 hypothetical protein [Leptospira soteropolitanensis]MCW7523155.1 hypothetical protein [Leptospira soteropolitanensis]MCW7526738.1 hypothetical protein [Leptospira soteropolitanensis]MCW7530873.1 hypothetical protein [Leptospira soteropolitanensis]
MANSSKDDKNKNAGLALGAIIILYSIYLTALNLINITTIWNFGIIQYAKNIVHIHADNYIKLTRNFDVYDGQLSIEDTENQANIKFKLKSGQIVKYKGYSGTSNISYIAIQFFEESKKVSGYILLPKPKKWDFFELENEENFWYNIKIDNFKNSLRNKYLHEVKSKIKFQTESNSLKAEKLIQSKEFQSEYRVIDDPDYYTIPKDGILYIPNNDYPLLKEIYENYFGKDIEVDFLQLSK